MLNPEFAHTVAKRFCVAKKPDFNPDQPLCDRVPGFVILETEKPFSEDRRLAQFKHV